MICTRRDAMRLGVGVVTALMGPRSAFARTVAKVEVRGSAQGERIWYDPFGLAVEPGTPIRFTKRDPVYSHTATAYHPAFLTESDAFLWRPGHGTAAFCCRMKFLKSR